MVAELGLELWGGGSLDEVLVGLFPIGGELPIPDLLSRMVIGMVGGNLDFGQPSSSKLWIRIYSNIQSRL